MLDNVIEYPRQDDLQAGAEWDRILVCRLVSHLAPHFIGNPAGAFAILQQMRAAVECLYDGDHEGAVTDKWRNVVLVVRLVRDVQGQCLDKAHALEVLQQLEYALNWQYQPGVQDRNHYNDDDVKSG